MDLSSLIFVALFVAWAVYLVPKALRSHEEETDSRSVDGFSDRLRVLARRDAVSASETVLVPAGRQVPAPPVDEEPAAPTPAPRAPRPRRSAAQRRRRVLGILLLANLLLVALAVGKVAHPGFVAVPASLLVAWLVACRLMVRRERAARVASVRKRRRTLADEVIAAEDDADAAQEPAPLSDDTDEIPVVVAEVLDEQPVVEGWTPVPVTLPTYVAKAPAGRTVRTIDLDSTGVWSSGRNEADSQLAREADAQRAQADADADVERRASGS